jgi:subtilisin family serine protease
MLRRTLLAVSLALLPAAGFAAGAAPGTYIVSFDDPPLAAFRGFDGDADPSRAALKATSPAVTGEAKLDVGSPQARAYRAWLGQRRADHLARMAAALGRPVPAEAAFDVVNNAVVVTLDAGEADRLAKLPGIAQVEPEFVRRRMTDAGPQWIGADLVWSGAAGVASRGAGIVVGVIDSGINRTHPSFAAVGPVDGHVHVNPRGTTVYGLCATSPSLCNAKLIGIHDFTICTGVHASSSCDDREANNGLDPDGHGSHVASTAAGNRLNASLSLATGSVNRQLSGVAPHANLISYKACEEEEDCRGSWLLAAINKAAEERVDVINYSIGGGASDPWATSDATAMLNAREAGVVVVVAAGNDGPRAGSVTSPGIAPWVITVANATHDRGIVNRIVDLEGGATPPPSGGVLLGVGSTLGYGPARIVVPLDFPGCSIGNDIDSPPSGISNPWSGQVFNGEIVVCARGTQARVAKSNNVRLAGGGGMILTNTALEGESIVSDAHSIPGSHIGQRDGEALRAWLANGSDHRGRIEGAQVRSEPALADLLASSSGRGPGPAAGNLKPNIAAPGTSIWAASGSGNGLAFLSGTSMATPHVTGAVALLRALRPGWTVSDIESALVGTARFVVRSSDGSGLATPFEQGGGRLDVVAALGAGLSLPVTPQEFRNARPSIGGRPETLNQAGIVLADCFESCRITRRVRDLVGGGRWAVESAMPAGITLVPSVAEFDIAASGLQSIEFEFRVDDPRLLGQWVSGEVRLRRIGGAVQASDSLLPVILFADPGPLPSRAVDIAARRSRLRRRQPLRPGRAARPRCQHHRARHPGAAQRGDTAGSDQYLGVRQLRHRHLLQPAAAAGVFGRRATTAWSPIWLRPPRSMSTCSSAWMPTPTVVRTRPRSCAGRRRPVPSNAASSTWLPRRWTRRSGSWRRTGKPARRECPTASRLRACWSIWRRPPSRRSRSSGPANVARGDAFALRVAADVPDLLAGGRRVGFVRLHAAGDAPAPFATLRVEVERQPDSAAAARALVPGRSLAMRLAAGDGCRAAVPRRAGQRLGIDRPHRPAAAATCTSTPRASTRRRRRSSNRRRRASRPMPAQPAAAPRARCWCRARSSPQAAGT